MQPAFEFQPPNPSMFDNTPSAFPFLFELPVRLNRSIELEAYAQACKYYSMASGVLRRYDHVPSLHAIRLEADATIPAGRLPARRTAPSILNPQLLSDQQLSSPQARAISTPDLRHWA